MASGVTAAPMASRRDRFSALAIVLHWTIAGLIAFNIYLGLKFDGLPILQKFQALQLHKSVGITVLVLSVLRLAWRLIHKPPGYPEGMKPWEKAVASATHWGFYGLMLGLPLVGWFLVSVSVIRIPTLLYKTIPFPHMPGTEGLTRESRQVLEFYAANTHETLAFITVALIVLHVGAALKHQFVTKDGVLYRMLPLPFLRSRAQD